MKTTIKYICTGLSLCACTCLVNNLPAQAETTNTAAVSATETGWDRQSIMEVARRVADWQIKDYPENKYAKSEPRGWIAGAVCSRRYLWLHGAAVRQPGILLCNLPRTAAGHL